MFQQTVWSAGIAFRLSTRRICLFALALITTNVCADTIKLNYDDADRVVQVQAAAGTTEYRYDAGGNITSVVTPAANAVTISELSPNAGAVGEQVTLVGTGFSNTLTANIVKFNGVAATVVAATSTALTATIPVGANSGPISVTVAGNTAVSLDDFTVTSSDPNGVPTITNIAANGGSVVITGTNFVGSSGNAWVRVNGQLATVASVTSTQITFSMPAGTTSGLITLGTSNGDVTQSAFLTGTLTANATATTLSTTQAGQNLSYAFSAIAGQSLDIVWNGNTFGYPFTITVYAPNGTQLSSKSVVLANTLPMPNLPATGTYVVVLTPSASGTGSANLQLLTEATSPLVADGVSLPVSLSTGQNGDFVFDGTAGQTLGLGIAGFGTSPPNMWVLVNVIEPNNLSILANCGYFYGNGSCKLPALPSTGAYTVRVIPPGDTSASLNLTLSNDIQSTLITNTATATKFSTSRAGQYGRYSFNAAAGQNLGLVFGGITFSNPVTITVYNPDGTQLNSASVSATTSSAYVMPNLPATGLYTVIVGPNGADTGTLNMWVKLTSTTDPVQFSSLVVDGASVSFLANKTFSYYFSGTVGQILGLAISGVSTSPPSGSVTASVIGPDNVTTLVNCSPIATSGNCNLPALPSTGTYTVSVAIPSNLAANFTLALSNDVGGTLTENGTVTSFTATHPGQTARYTFSATSGQNVNLVSSGSTFANTGTVAVYKPDGTLLSSKPFYSGTTSTLTMVNLPATGLYTIFVNPNGADTGAVNLQLVTEITSALTADGASLPINLATGQVGNFTFGGVAGQTLGLGITGFSTLPASGWILVNVIDPDNATVLINCSYFYGSGSCNLPALPSTGTYKVRLTPPTDTSVNLTLTLSNDVLSTLPTNTATVTPFATTRAGQNGRYVFNAAAGQSLGLVFDGNTFTNPVSVTVYKPDGTPLNTVTSNKGIASAYVMPNLTTTGLYTAFFDPNGVDTGTINTLAKLTSSADPVQYSALTINGVPVTFNSSQTFSYAFSGAWNQALSLSISGVSTSPLAGSVTVSVIEPDNVSTLISCGAYVTSGNCNLPALPSTGTYTVKVVLPKDTSANLTLALKTNVSGALTNNAAATPITIPIAGQVARYAFNATAGQNLDLRSNGGTFSSAVMVTVYKPDGTQLTSKSFLGPNTLAMPNLPATGAYSVVFVPDWSSTGTMNVQLLTEASSPLAADGASLPVILSTGQNGNFSFGGAAGQTFGLGIGGFATTPANGWILVNVIDPDNTTMLVNCSYYYGNGSCNIPALPSTGTYTVRVIPPGDTSANLTLTLSSDATANMVVNGAAVPFSTSRLGQNARFTFTGVSGGTYMLSWSGPTFSGGVYVYDPNGTNVGLGSLTQGANGSLTLSTVSTSGTYSVFVDPTGTATGQVNLSVTGDKVASAPDQGDVPLPGWALSLLAIALSYAMVCHRIGLAKERLQ